MEFVSAADEDEALALLATYGDQARVLAGGTDLMLQLQRGEVAPRMLLHIGRHATLREIVWGTELRIGALVTHDQLRRDPEVARRLPGLAEAARTVGGWQTQAVATLGGNICNASPAADTLPPLLVGDATVELASTAGIRRMTVESFVMGRRSTARWPSELLTGLSLAPPPPRTGEVYLKVAPRSAMEVALVGLAVRLTLTQDDRALADARVAVCAVGPRPFRAREAEAALVEGWPDPDAVALAGELLARRAEPIDDARATAHYRRRVLPALLSRAVGRCVGRARAA
jgi:carbon-monoxide dehydrogenase medium subunit